MPELKFDFDEEHALKKVLEELENKGKEKEQEILRSIFNILSEDPNDPGRQYWRNIKSKGKSRQHLSWPLLASFAHQLGKPIEFFIYETEIYMNMVKENYLKIPYIEPITDKNNNLVVIKNKALCAMRYDYLTKLTNSPLDLVLLTVNTDSMQNTLFKGDDIIVDTAKKVIFDGAIYAFNTFSFKSIQVRRFLIQINKLKLVADNREFYEPCITDIKDINIIGQVIVSKHILF